MNRITDIRLNNVEQVEKAIKNNVQTNAEITNCDFKVNSCE